MGAVILPAVVHEDVLFVLEGHLADPAADLLGGLQGGLGDGRDRWAGGGGG